MNCVKFVAISCLLCCLAAALWYIPTQSEEAPSRVLIKNTGGTVVFNHKNHLALSPSCTTCHHEHTSPRPDVQPCRACHGQQFTQEFAKTHVAKINDGPACVTCHHKEVAKARWNHDRHHKEYELDCRFCHHDDLLLEPKPESCTNCHTPGISSTRNPDPYPYTMGDVAHKRCAYCHGEWFEAGVKGCVHCHPQKDMRATLESGKLPKVDPVQADCIICHRQAPKKLVPGGMQAFHSRCMGCHEQRKAGPFGSKSCQQCHLK